MSCKQQWWLLTNIALQFPMAHRTGMQTNLPSTSVIENGGHDQGNVPCGAHHSCSPKPCTFIFVAHHVIGSWPIKLNCGKQSVFKV